MTRRSADRNLEYSPGNMVRFLFLLTLPLLLWGGSAAGQDLRLNLTQYAHTAWRLQDGAFAGIPQAITQTSDGYLWVGTTSGLLRFNGDRFEDVKLPLKEVKQGWDVLSLLSARDGSLWIGSPFNIIQLKNCVASIPPNGRHRTNQIVQTRKGEIWMVRTRSQDPTGPLCEVGPSVTCHGKNDGIQCRYGGSLAEDATGQLWIGNENGLCAWKDGHATAYYPANLGPTGSPQTPSALLPLPDDSLLVGFTRTGEHFGLQRLVAGKFEPFIVPGLDGRTVTIHSLYADREGSVWIGTGTKGVFHVFNGAADHLGAEDGLSGQDVVDLFEDREGSIWLITTEGVDQLHSFPVTTYTTKDGLSSDDATTVLASPDGTTWAGMFYGLDKIHGETITPLLMKDGLPGDAITPMYQDAAGDLWMEADNHLTRYSHGKFTVFNRPNGDPMGSVQAIAGSRDGSIYVVAVGRPPRLFRVVDGKTVVEMPVSVTRAMTLTTDHMGQLWLGDANGEVDRYTDHAVQRIPSPDSAGVYFQLLVDGPQIFWRSSLQGLYRFQEGKWQLMNEQNGLPCQTVQAVIIDRQRSLWLKQPCGLVQISNAELKAWWGHPNYVLKTTVFGSLDGFRPGSSPFTPVVDLSSDGKVWLANDHSLQMVDPAHLHQNLLAPPVYIERITADRVPHLATDAITLPALNRDLTLD